MNKHNLKALNTANFQKELESDTFEDIENTHNSNIEKRINTIFNKITTAAKEHSPKHSVTVFKHYTPTPEIKQTLYNLQTAYINHYTTGTYTIFSW